MRRLCLAAIGFAATLAFTAHAQQNPPPQATFYPLGVLPGALFSQPYHLSRDGSTVVGSSPINLGTVQAFTWRANTGMVQLAAPSGFSQPIASAVNADGTIAAGNAYINADPNHRKVIRWLNGTPQSVDDPQQIISSDVWDMSADGSVMTGSRAGFAYRWTAAAGFQDLGTLPGQDYSRGFGMSADGNVIVGETNFDAFRWTGSSMAALPRVPTASYARAQALSGDGHVAVGESNSLAVRWVGTGQPQTMWLGGTWSTAYGVDHDGDSVVGSAALASGVSVATLWTPALGLKDLNTYLPALGLSLTGWTLYEARSISSDGTVIVGTGWHTLPGGGQRQEAWVVMIPAPPTFGLLLALGALTHRRRTQSVRPPALPLPHVPRDRPHPHR